MTQTQRGQQHHLELTTDPLGLKEGKVEEPIVTPLHILDANEREMKRMMDTLSMKDHSTALRPTDQSSSPRKETGEPIL